MSDLIHKNLLLKVVVLADLHVYQICPSYWSSDNHIFICYIFRLYVFNLPNVAVDSDFSTIFVSFIFQRALWKVQKFKFEKTTFNKYAFSTFEKIDHRYVSLQLRV